MLVLFLSGCAAAPDISSVGRYSGPEATIEPETEFPRVFTDIKRTDTLKTEAARQAEIDALRAEGDTHVDDKETAIVR